MLELGEQIPEAAGFNFRMRTVNFEPGGATANHSHAELPAIGYVLDGEITELRPTKTRTLAQGESWFEDATTEHWVINQTDAEATVLLFEIVPAEG